LVRLTRAPLVRLTRAPLTSEVTSASEIRAGVLATGAPALLLAIEDLAQAIVEEVFQQLGQLALRIEPVEKSVEKLCRHRHKRLLTPFARVICLALFRGKVSPRELESKNVTGVLG
jgi:hypothetical protein